MCHTGIAFSRKEMEQFFILRDGLKIGPFSETEIRQKMEIGEVADTDFLWREGMSEWQEIKTALTSGNSQESIQQKFRLPYTYVRAEVFIRNLSIWDRFKILIGARLENFITEFQLKHVFVLGKNSRDALAKGQETIPISKLAIPDAWQDGVFTPTELNRNIYNIHK